MKIRNYNMNKGITLIALVITISENNKVYKTYQNAIYSKNGETLIYGYSKNKIIELENGVKKLVNFLLRELKM